MRGAVAACCDRLVGPAAAPAERPRLSRLAGSLIGGSFVAASAAALTLPAVAGVGGVLSGVSAILAFSWLTALVAASGKASRLLSLCALGAAAAGLPVLAMVSGGAASPLALLLAALVIEPWWVERTRAAAKLGVAAMGLAIVTLAVASAIGLDVAPAQAWHWLPTLAYAAWAAARLVRPVETQQSEQDSVDLFTATGTIAVTLSQSGDAQDVRGDTMALLGVPAPHIAGSGLFERILVGDRVAFLCALDEVRAGATHRRVEAMVRLARNGGDDAPAHSRLRFDILRAPDGDGEFLALVSRDAEAERLRGELALADERRAEMALVRDRMLASVSHELRTPLNAIIGFSDMLLMELFGTFTDPRQKEYVTLVRESGQHLLEVVNSILDVSKLQSGAYAVMPEPFRVDESIAMCRAMMTGQADAKTLRIAVDVEPGLPDLVADRRAVQQMLINLVANAIKFTPAGGEIVVSARRRGGMLALSVADNGIGIAAHDLERLGQPFTQVHNDYTRQYDGAGLGLSLVKGLVALHGGAMSMESSPGLGTTVTLALPLDGLAAIPKDNLISLAERQRDGFRKTA